MKIKNMMCSGVHGVWIPETKWNRMVELIERNNVLIKELKGDIQDE